MPKITGKIVRILDRRTIIINLGENMGVTENTIFSIYGKPEKIIDPENNSELGQVILIKAKVKAVQVFEKFTIASSRWKEFNFPLTAGSLFSQVSEIDDDLHVDPEEIQPWKAIEEEPVRLGDEVEAEVAEIPEEGEEFDNKPDNETPNHDVETLPHGEDTNSTNT